MTKLNEEARQQLDAAGISITEWSRRFSDSSTWGGDMCGCPDYRCIGHHHAADEPCGCLNSLIREYVTEQRSSLTGS